MEKQSSFKEVQNNIGGNYDLFSYNKHTSKEVGEVLDYEICPGCGEASFIYNACQSCHYTEFPDFNLPESLKIQNKNETKTLKSHRQRIYLKEHFFYGDIEGYAVFLTEDQKNIKKIIAKIGKKSFIFHIDSYQKGENIFIDPRNISFQTGNLKSSKGRLYRLLSPSVLHFHKEITQYGGHLKMYEEIISFISFFLQEFHETH